ncbi:unnamed protein product [Penicillium salamii]|uniref:Epoxide hydrolase N-terminal domain-containing protein n=1 Tax=Penicillium salamii TaxID=1612424 RepID=A0A9W4NX18_9EURO|nr:unnamed protein product [Penicillium salamii]CAG8361147.1 unnamed protein product [Penicillium salamii]CAG8420532.1 unnamed protein product [Penicillium salamii]CAG8423914.1 unnamed protein product [Penicillium salamii]
MRSPWISFLALGVACRTSQATPTTTAGFKLQPFQIDLSSNLPRMLDLVRTTRLPAQSPYISTGSSAGISLGDLKALQDEWLTTFDWKKEEKSLNKFNHYTAQIEGLDIHFIHERSSSKDAIPLILLHGWPGSFLEFAPIINELTKTAKSDSGKQIAFDVIVPSLPGFAFSSAPPTNWTIDDSARVFNTLLKDVLGYESYAVFGTDWGSGVAYSMYDQFNTTVRAAHLAFLPFYPLNLEQLAAENITLSSLEGVEEANTIEWTNSGTGYFSEQTTKPNTIGLALYDSPVGQLAWIGEKFLNWSDPNAGHGPSLLSHNEILRSVSLYFLTETFASSVVIYAQNPHGFRSVYSKANNDAPLLFSAFKYNPGFWPPALVAKVGNLVYYKNHEFGGHFPGVDNPDALLADLRQIGEFWEVLP